MNESARIEKNNAIKEHGKETRIRHTSMRPVVIEMKLDLKCLNKTEQGKLWHYFTQCRWLCNYLISLDADAFRSFDNSAAGCAITSSLLTLMPSGLSIQRQGASHPSIRMAILLIASLQCLPSSSRRYIHPSSRTWSPLPQRGIRQGRRTAS